VSKEYLEAKERIATQREAIINLLKSKGTKGATNDQLQRISLRYSSILSIMRDDGYDVAVEFHGNGLCSYILVKEPDGDWVDLAKEKAKDILLSKINGKISVKDLLALISENELVIMKKKRLRGA
jgi:hypothetical protein